VRCKGVHEGQVNFAVQGFRQAGKRSRRTFDKGLLGLGPGPTIWRSYPVPASPILRGTFIPIGGVNWDKYTFQAFELPVGYFLEEQIGRAERELRTLVREGFISLADLEALIDGGRRGKESASVSQR